MKMLVTLSNGMTVTVIGTKEELEAFKDAVVREAIQTLGEIRPA